MVGLGTQTFGLNSTIVHGLQEALRLDQGTWGKSFVICVYEASFPVGEAKSICFASAGTS